AQATPQIMQEQIAKLANDKLLIEQNNGQLIIQNMPNAGPLEETKLTAPLLESKSPRYTPNNSNVTSSVVSIPAQKLNYGDIESIVTQIESLKTPEDASSFLNSFKPLALKQFISLLNSIPIAELDLQQMPLPFWDIPSIKKIQTALETLQKLYSLNLDRSFTYDNVQHSDITPITTAISSFSNLRKLNLSNNQLDQLTKEQFKLITNAIGQLTQLRELVLPNNNLGGMNDNYIEEFTNSLGKLVNLEVLDARNNNLGNLSMDYFSKALGKLTKLIHINLSANNLGNLTPESVEQFAEALAKLVHIKTLAFNENNLGNLNDASIAPLGNALGQQKELTFLDLSNNALNKVKNLSPIADAISKLLKLQKLNLSNNNHNAEAENPLNDRKDFDLASILKALENSNELKFLDLSHNRLDKLLHDMHLITSSIGKLDTVQALNLSNNNLASLHHVFIEKLMKQVIGLKQLELIDLSLNNQNNVYNPDNFWTPITEIFKNAQTLYLVNVQNNNHDRGKAAAFKAEIEKAVLKNFVDRKFQENAENVDLMPKEIINIISGYLNMEAEPEEMDFAQAWDNAWDWDAA
ncbi:hypothetical protein N9N97_02640, partial [Rickettsiaceae bacterium]|nr:hypothetical protein [Rickettsiaceae bacterium]